MAEVYPVQVIAKYLSQLFALQSGRKMKFLQIHAGS